jgi:PAS domain-containing protein
MSARIDYSALKAMAAALGRPLQTLYPLAGTNDPFMAGSPARNNQAEWFYNIWIDFDLNAGVHLRRIHYLLVSQKTPFKMLNGLPYENTTECWQDLCEAAKDARYLRLVPSDAFVDKRTALPICFLEKPSVGEGVSLSSTASVSHTMPLRLPEPPKLHVDAPTVAQRYHVEIWAEKTTMDDVLRPLAQQYRCNLVQGAGEQSVTRCDELVERAKLSGRPVRILYISDFDPAGLSMPLAVARKIEHRIRTDGMDLDIQLRPVILTADQCREYALPRTPIKVTERRAQSFEARHGDGATELDALEALHPGVLRQIMSAELDRYFDHTLDLRVVREHSSFQDFLDDQSAEVAGRYADELHTLDRAYRELRNRFDTEFMQIRERMGAIHSEIENSLDGVDVGHEWPAPARGHEHPDPLFDSKRPYIEQNDRYKLHQGKPTQGKVVGRKRTAA